jgi:hypothetical protein
MSRVVPFALAVLGTCCIALSPGTSRADTAPAAPAAGALYVLSIGTEDADDQADALTQALRSRVRQSPQWSLLETAQSFDTLAIALKCPPRPDPPCLQRIGDQLHADRYLWGALSRKRGMGQVTADVHLWSRGKPDELVVETYSDNLKDASDEALQTISTRILGKLLGMPAPAPVAPRPPAAEPPPPIETPHQMPKLEDHSSDTVVADRHSGLRGRTIVGLSAVAAGVGLFVAAGVEGLAWLNDRNASVDDRNMVPKSVTDVCATQGSFAAQDACSKTKDALTASTLGWVFAGAGALLVGAGVFLAATDRDATPTSPDLALDGHTRRAPRADAYRVSIVPSLGLRAGALDLRVTF